MAERIEGWMGRGPRRWLADQAAQHARIIEVGVWKGLSTRILVEATSGVVWAVDHWQGTPDQPEQHELYREVDRRGADGVYQDFCAALGPWIQAGRVIPVRMSSLEAAELLLAEHGATFDFVFIDADHSYAGCAFDIAAYRKLVCPGGLLAGHDYKERWPGVMRAVDEAFGGAVTIGPKSIWSVTL